MVECLPRPLRVPSPPREFSLMPFWFWNDQLEEAEIVRQIADFETHGVHGFVIHPRMGLPREIGWMSDALLGFMDIAIEEAARRGMRVILYDEGMYPSGSSSGQVVAEDPSLACRCLKLLEAGEPMPARATLVASPKRANGQSVAVIDAIADAYIRGIHFIDESKNLEDEPAAGDILNPRTAQVILKLVYERFFERFGKHFGKTIIGIFTDEPNPLGKPRNDRMRAGNAAVLADVSARLGYDFAPHLPALWFDEPNAAKYRADYDWAIRRRLEETWYRPLSQWCESHGVALCGHPDRGDEIGAQRFFHIPGQDLVWRFVVPGNSSALEGPESTQAKCSSSAMIHNGRMRNSNEFCGAYGAQTTFDEFRWLANWCLIRGVNLLIPHAFYYSVRGPRRDERPPQVGGVGCAWWNDFKPFADHCRFLSWLNTDSQHVCNVAILAPPDHCPWHAAKVCFENQIDFNYLDANLIETEVRIDDAGVRIRGMSYAVLILDHVRDLTKEMGAKLAPLAKSNRLANFGGEVIGDPIHSTEALAEFLRRADASRISITPAAPALRIRQVHKNGARWGLFFNEGDAAISGELSLASAISSGEIFWVDAATGVISRAAAPIRLELQPHATALLMMPFAADGSLDFSSEAAR